MKKIYLNIFFQLAALSLIIKVFFFDDVGYDRFALLRTEKLVLLVVFSIIVNLLITFLFFKILNVISSKKIKYLDITSVHLQGALVNQVLPGLGFIFRYYKFKLYSNINVIVYSISQSIWSFSSLIVYFLSAIILGFLVITSLSRFLFLSISILLLIILIIKFRYNFYNIVKKIIYKFKKTSSFINDLKKVKESCLKNKEKFILIFIGFIILLILECFIFYIALKFFGINISILNSCYIWITSTLITALALINFFGLFEIIVTLSAALIVPEIDYLLIFAVNLRIINLISILLIIVYCLISKKLINQ